MVYQVHPISTFACTMARSDGSGSSSAHLLVDEPVVSADDDGTYLEATANAQGAILLLTSPVLSNHYIFKIRFRAKSSSFSDAKIGFDFPDVGALGPFREPSLNITTAWTTYEITVNSLTKGNFVNDFNQLYIQFQCTLTNSATLRLSAIEIEFLDPINLNVTRQSLNVLAESPSVPQLRITRQAIDVLAKYVPPAIPLNFTRQAIDVLGKALPALRVTRQAVDVLSEAPPPNLIFTHQAIDVLGENIYVMTVFPNALPTPLPSFFLHNWQIAVRVRSAWSTDITQAQSVSEDRLSLVERPYRTVNVKFTGMRRNEATTLMMNIVRLSNSRLILPLFCDKSKTTGTSSGTTILCDTTMRRFFRGGRVAIHIFDTNNRAKNVEYGIIIGLTTGSITLQNPLVNVFPAGARVYPVIDTEIVLNSSGVHVTDEVFDIDLAVNEITGKSALYTIGDELPGGISTFNGKPVFRPRINWASDRITDVERVGEEIQNGRGVLVSIQGTRPQFSPELAFTSRNRAEAWNVIQFTEYIRGRGRSFYIVAPETYFKVTAITATSLTVEAAGNATDIASFIKVVAILMRDGTTYLRDITSVVDNGTTFTLNFLTLGLTPVLGNIRRATSGHLVRLDHDDIVEDWVTDEHCIIKLKVIELLEEKDVALLSLDETYSFVSGPEEIDDLVFWADASFNTWLYDGTPPGNHNQPAIAQGDLVYNWDDFREGVTEPFLRCTPPLVFAFNGGAMVYFTDTNVNNGRRMIQAFYPPSKYWLMDQFGYETDFVNNSLGLTLIYNVRTNLDGIPGFPPGSIPKNQYFIQPGVLEWLGDNIKIFTTVDVVNTNLWIQNLPNLRTGELMTLVLRWVPGQVAKLYKNGALIGQSTSTIASLPTGTGREIEMFTLEKYFSETALGDGAYGNSNWINTVGMYDRALTTSEINQIGNYLKARYGSPWSNIP